MRRCTAAQSTHSRMPNLTDAHVGLLREDKVWVDYLRLRWQCVESEKAVEVGCACSVRASDAVYRAGQSKQTLFSPFWFLTWNVKSQQLACMCANQESTVIQ
jgi:hypothetical protein